MTGSEYEASYYEAESAGTCAVCTGSIRPGDMVRSIGRSEVHAECDQDRIDCPFCGGQVMEGTDHPECVEDHLAGESLADGAGAAHAMGIE